jgi:hypothetical protein
MTCPPLLLLRRQAFLVSQHLSAIVAVVAIVVIVVIVVRCAIAVAVVVRCTVAVDVVVCCADTVVTVIVRRSVTLVTDAIVHRTPTEKEGNASSLLVF